VWHLAPIVARIEYKTAYTRPVNLQDVIGAIQDNASGANSPDLTIDETFSVLAVVNEKCLVKDATYTVVATTNSTLAWGTGKVGEVIW
jgi:hypothetical protein